MARFNPIKNSFVAGELSPRLEGRDDLAQYFQGQRRTQNGIVLPHGGFLRRSGARFVKEVKDSTKKTRLFPFLFSTVQAYVVEAGNLYYRFFTNEGNLESGGSPVEVVTPYLEAELFSLASVQEADVMYQVQEKHPLFKLERTSATTFTHTEVDYTDGHAPLQAVNLTATTITVTTGPLTLTASSAIFSTTNDVGRWVRVDTGRYKIDSVSSTTVALATLKGGTNPVGAQTDWALGLTSDTEGPAAVVIHEGRLGIGGSPAEPDRFVLSKSDDFENFDLGTGASDEAISRRTVSGQVNNIRWMVSGGSESLLIGTAGGEFRVRGDNDDLLTPTGTVVKPTTKRGSPAVQPVIVGDQIVFLQRNSRKLREILFDIGATAFKARDISILAEHILTSGVTELEYQQDPDSVIWNVRADGQQIGFTFEEEQRVVGAHRHLSGGTFDGGDAVVDSVAVIPHPSEIEDQLWWIAKRTINGATTRYVEFWEDQFRPNLTTSSTRQEKIDALDDAFFVDSGLSLDSPITVTNITQANPGVVTAASHGFSDGDEVMIREVKGMTEVNKVAFKVANSTGSTFELNDLNDNNVDTTGFTAYASGGKVREQVGTVSGLTHLEGETVQILANGAVHPDKTVVSGAVTLERNASIVHVGLAADYWGETQRFIGGGRIGTDQGKQARIQRVVVRLHNTLGGAFGVGPNPRKVERPLYRTGSDPMDQSPPLFTGDKEVPVEGTEDAWTKTPTVYFENRQPLPMTILAIMPYMESWER